MYEAAAKPEVYVIAGVKPRTKGEKLQGVPIGLGEALLHRILKDPDTAVIATYHSKEPDQEFLDALPSKDKVRFLRLDSSVAEDYSALHDYVKESHGSIDHLIHSISAIPEPSRTKRRDIIQRMKINNGLALQDLPANPNVVYLSDYNPDDLLKAIDIIAVSYARLQNAMDDLMPAGSNTAAFTFVNRQTAPNYAAANLGKMVLEELALKRGGEDKKRIHYLFNTGFYLSPKTSTIPYSDHLVEHIREKYRGKVMTADDVAGFVYSIISNNPDLRDRSPLQPSGKITFDMYPIDFTSNEAGIFFAQKLKEKQVSEQREKMNKPVTE